MRSPRPRSPPRPTTTNTRVRRPRARRRATSRRRAFASRRHSLLSRAVPFDQFFQAAQITTPERSEYWAGRSFARSRAHPPGEHEVFGPDELGLIGTEGGQSELSAAGHEPTVLDAHD